MHRNAFTLVETALAALLLGVGFWLLSGLYARELETARRRQAIELITRLESASTAYHADEGAYPPGNTEGGSAPAVVAMFRVPPSAEVLGTVEPKLMHSLGGVPRCLDPWGRPPRYLTSTVGRDWLKQRVAENGGRPIFESAGPDGRFGWTNEPQAAADDIRSDDPGM